MRIEKYFKEEIIKDFYMKQIKVDFMGYTYSNTKELSLHHIVPSRCGGETTYDNTCLLVRNTSHDYAHTIEAYEQKLYDYISKLILLEKQEGKISAKRLKEIREILLEFEYIYDGKINKKGKPIIKPEYKRERIKL